MAQTRKHTEPAAPISDEALAAKVRDALHERPLKASELAKAIGKAAAPRALQLARERVAAGELFQQGTGSSEWFFVADPIATLDRVVPELVRQMGPLSPAALKAKAFKAAMDQAAPGHSHLVAGWLEGAIHRQLLFERPQGRAKPKLLAADPPTQATDAEIATKVRAALKEGARMGSELSALLDETDGPRALRAARDAAATGELHRVLKGKEEWFFGIDPRVTLDTVVPSALRRIGRAPAKSKELKAAVEKVARGHSVLLDDWLPAAVARGLVFELPEPGAKKKTVLSADPDLKLQLGKALAELNQAVAALERQGITRERVLDFLRAELKGAPAVKPEHASAKHSSREVFLEALRRLAEDNPKGALLPVRELRARAGLAKQEFDMAALDLSKEGLLVLHHHDHAAILSEAEQSGLVRDALGRHYVGIALRGSA